MAESTVTRVLSGGYASDETRKRVLQLAKELNYIPNALAQGLRTRRTYQIACLVLSIDSPFYGQLMLGVEDVATRNGYVLTMYSSNVVEQSCGSTFFTGRHDGIILLSVNHHRLLEQLNGVRVPIVVYSDAMMSSPLPSVGIDLKAAVQGVVQYLAGLGHKDIGYIGTEDADKPVNPRLEGFTSGMDQCGLTVGEHQIQFIHGPGSMESGYTGMAELHRHFPDVTAVFAMNDLVSFGAMRWMQDKGLRIPEDISIVGCYDIAYSSMCYPPLTTIQIPKREIGNQMMGLLQRTIDEQEPSISVLGIRLPTRLIVRASATNVKTV